MWRTTLSTIKKLYTISALSFCLLLALVWLFPLSFTACSRGSLWCEVAFALTESAGKIGTPIVVIGACFFYSFRVETWKQRFVVFLRAFCIVGCTLASVSYINEHYTKEWIHLPRPSHLVMMQQALPAMNIDSLYSKSVTLRHEVLRKSIETNKTYYASFDSKILNHWVDEAGYSFPSGHSFNAFLLATLLTFSMLHSRNRLANVTYIVPYVWALLVAVSRVAIGAHSELDVTVGALMGIVLGNVFLYFDFTRQSITKREV